MVRIRPDLLTNQEKMLRLDFVLVESYMGLKHLCAVIYTPHQELYTTETFTQLLPFIYDFPFRVQH